MTLQASSQRQTRAKRFNPWAHAFRLGLRQNAAVTAVATFVFLLLYTALPAINLIIDNTKPDTLPEYKYLFFFGYTSIAQQLFPWLALVSALLHGVLSFRFLHGRKSSIAWISLGLSRNDVFWSRFASGAAGALLPVVISLTVTLGFNLVLSPAVGLILARYAFFLIGMCLQILVLYSVTVAVCARVATTAEGAFFSVVLCMLPSVAIIGINAMMEKLLLGTPYLQSSYYPSNLNLSLLRALSSWNPLFLFGPYMSVLGSEPVSIDALGIALMSMMRPNSANWLLLLGWALAAAAIVCLARWLFMRRKAEIAGRMGDGYLLGILCVLTVGFAAFGIIYSLPFYLPKNMAFWVPFLSASGAALAAMLVVALLLRLYKRPRWYGFAAVFGGLAVMAALVGIFATGGLGYSGYVPDARNVKSVTILYNGLDHFIQEFELEQDGFMPNSFGVSPCVTLTDEGDIGIVTDIHRKLVNAGRLDTDLYSAGSPKVFDTAIRIQYKLKSGAIVARTYHGLTADLVKSAIALDDTAGVKQAYADTILHPQKDFRRIATYFDGFTYLCSPQGSEILPLNLAADAHSELLQCLVDDFSAQPSADRYLPDGPPVCVVEFTPKEHGSAKQLGDEDKLHYFGNNPVYVTRHFTHTLAFLETHAIQIPADKPTVQIDVYEYSDQYVPFECRGLGTFPMFTTEYSSSQAAEEYNTHNGRKMTVTDPEQIQGILPYCRSVYLMSEGGYPLLMKFDGSNQYVSAFLPMKDAPDFIRMP